jgi:hypothetical protein
MIKVTSSARFSVQELPSAVNVFDSRKLRANSLCDAFFLTIRTFFFLGKWRFLI